MKTHFWAGKQPVELNKEYQAVVFGDCLINYKLDILRQHLIKAHLVELHEGFNYPKEVANFDFNKGLSVILNNGLWDIEHGTILKINENNVVAQAVYGFETLSI